MSATDLDIFDKTLQTTHIWLDELMEEIGPDRQVAWHVLGAVLRAIRDRVPLELAIHLGAQLPILIRGTYYDQWSSPGAIDKSRAAEEFLARIGQGLASTRPAPVACPFCRSVRCGGSPRRRSPTWSATRTPPRS